MATNVARKRVSETESGLNQSANSDAAASSIMVKRPKVAGKGTGGRDGYLYYFRSYRNAQLCHFHSNFMHLHL